MIASGDLRLSANRVCWPAQQQVEQAVTRTVESFGFELKRGHPVDAAKQQIAKHKAESALSEVPVRGVAVKV